MNDFLTNLENGLNSAQAESGFRRGSRPAAVVCLMYRRQGEWRIPFVRRRKDLPDHPGQVALPGGGVRAGETAWQGAERELEEELGVRMGQSRPLGSGRTFYTAVSNFSVATFVAHLETPDPIFTHDPGELEGILEVPLLSLLEEAAWKKSVVPWVGSHFPFEDTFIWGLTARILDDLLPRFRQALQAAGQSRGLPAPPERG